MRDILITLIVFASLPLILRDPVAGILMWVWLSVMNPHTQGWGFAQTFPYAYLVALATLFSVAVARAPKLPPWCACTAMLLLFILWMNVTTLFAMFPAAAHEQWTKVMKIMLMSLVTLVVIRRRAHVHRLIWVLVLSLGYYGVKGGLFTLRGGGADRVWGPQGTFIGGNNEIALALVMTIPLMLHLYRQHRQRWLRCGLAAMMLLSALAALGSYSRGALLALLSMGCFLWLRSGRKLLGGAMLAALGCVLLAFMPQRWEQRMDTIGDYQQDSSAMGRINAWHMAYNLARDRFFGGGFEISEPAAFLQYAPNSADVHAAHSIYFQALGEHGFVGLGLYLLLGWCAWHSAARIAALSRDSEELAWAASLAAMLQASLVGFAVGGAFLSLLYFDVPYYLMAAIIATRLLLERRP
ncbi:putative O-glycosylation ligase, exosortase A system-associated [Oxalobacteraceae bacterium A2-2]